MIANAIKDRLAAEPFKPFVVRMGSGDEFLVRHPELVSISPGGRRMILWIDDERAADIDVLLIGSGAAGKRPEAAQEVAAAYPARLKRA